MNSKKSSLCFSFFHFLWKLIILISLLSVDKIEICRKFQSIFFRRIGLMLVSSQIDIKIMYVPSQYRFCFSIFSHTHHFYFDPSWYPKCCLRQHAVLFILLFLWFSVVIWSLFFLSFLNCFHFEKEKKTCLYKVGGELKAMSNPALGMIHRVSHASTRALTHAHAATHTKARTLTNEPSRACTLKFGGYFFFFWRDEKQQQRQTD